MSCKCNGTYGSLNKNIISTIGSDDLAISKPIKIYAVKPGGVLVNAPSYLFFSGRGIILPGSILDPVAGDYPPRMQKSYARITAPNSSLFPTSVSPAADP